MAVPTTLTAAINFFSEPKTRDKFTASLEKWMKTATPRAVVGMMQMLAVCEAAFLANDIIDGRHRPAGEVLPIFLRGKLGPLEWVAAHGTLGQKRALVEAGQLPESVLEGEIVQEKAERADA